MEKEMRELYIEGVATHGGPESCVDVCEDGSEALTGVVQAGLLSREITQFGVPTLSKCAEGHTSGGASASRQGTPRGQRTWACTKSPCARTGRSDGCPSAVIGWAGRTGKAKAVSL